MSSHANFSIGRASIADDHKNGHVPVVTRLSGILVPDFEDEGLKGAKATSHRRLPDIPDSVPNGSDNPDARQSSVRSSQDTSSELYAQVEIGTATNSCNLLVQHKDFHGSLTVVYQSQ